MYPELLHTNCMIHMYLRSCKTGNSVQKYLLTPLPPQVNCCIHNPLFFIFPRINIPLINEYHRIRFYHCFSTTSGISTDFDCKKQLLSIDSGYDLTCPRQKKACSVVTGNRFSFRCKSCYYTGPLRPKPA